MSCKFVKTYISTIIFTELTGTRVYRWVEMVFLYFSAITKVIKVFKVF